MLSKEFFNRSPEIVAKELLGKVIVRRNNGKLLKARIVETEAYFDENDPASRASKGDNKVSRMMNESPGKILIYNVHKYKMLNFVTCEKGIKSAVLIRAVEPLNFALRCSGPGLLTIALGINDEFHGKEFNKDFYVLDDGASGFEIFKSFRIGVTKDLEKPLRFYIKGNEHVSKK